jgi:hypothetical protein
MCGCLLLRLQQRKAKGFSIMAYTFDKKFDDGTFTVEVDTEAKYGHFEHNIHGEDRDGGLWFEMNETVYWH